jgi:ribosomal protein S18 acetylase RimI-like enzyme
LGPAEQTCVVEDGGRVVAAGTRWRTAASVVIDPRADAASAAEELTAWLDDVAAPEVDVLDRDEVLRAVLSRAGWRYAYSSFELLRPVGGDWQLPEPSWPPGVSVRAMADGEQDALHRLIYEDAAWADVAGHHHRPTDEWRRIFIDGRNGPERPLLAEADGRLVGAAVLRLFADGAGWISQLAVARSARGRGLGRALLLAGLRQLVDAGANKLGLGVMATNDGALRMYLDAGLRIEREFQSFRPPGGGPGHEVPAPTGGSA